MKLLPLSPSYSESSASSSADAYTNVLHDWQTVRISRCATTPTNAAAILNGSMPMSVKPVNGAPESFVCNVLSTKWPVTSLHRNLCGRYVANFTDHDDVRILPQNRTQHRSKRQLPRFIDLHLVHELDLVLNRVFDRHHIAVDAF